MYPRACMCVPFSCSRREPNPPLASHTRPGQSDCDSPYSLNFQKVSQVTLQFAPTRQPPQHHTDDTCPGDKPSGGSGGDDDDGARPPSSTSTMAPPLPPAAASSSPPSSDPDDDDDPYDPLLLPGASLPTGSACCPPARR